jgi:predicted TIM-barrel fold metal-dependent hydrolase
MRVIDSHVHFPENKIIDDGAAPTAERKQGIGYTSGRTGLETPEIKDKAQQWLQGERARWESAWRFPTPRQVNQEEGERLWAAEFDTYDYLKTVVFVTAGSNLFASELAARHQGRFVAYAHHDPLLPDAAQRLEKAVKEQGLRGYKILGPKVDKPISDPYFDPLWEIARDAGIPVLIHFGIMGAAGGIASHVNMNPMAIHDAAKRFPKVPFIVPHFGTGYLFDMLNLCWACPNVYIDTSGSNQWMRWMPYEVTLESLFRKFRETIGAGRIIFGTDSSWFPRGFTHEYLDAQVRAMADVGYSEDERDAVLYRNIASLLKIEGNDR